jgi:hypothetical protein
MAKPPFYSSGPSTKAFAITPNDAINFTERARRIFVGGAGTVNLVGLDALPVSFTCVAGQYIDCASIRVNATGTTATLLIGLD